MTVIPTRGFGWTDDASVGITLRRFNLVLKDDGFFYATTTPTAGESGFPAIDADGFVFGLTDDETGAAGYTEQRTVLKPDLSVEIY